LYFFVEGDLDLDNILKPILDSLKGIAYLDDSQVVEIVAAKRDLAATATCRADRPYFPKHGDAPVKPFRNVTLSAIDG
jgi:Endodeoxyribonuclease RusA